MPQQNTCIAVVNSNCYYFHDAMYLAQVLHITDKYSCWVTPSDLLFSLLKKTLTIISENTTNSMRYDIDEWVKIGPYLQSSSSLHSEKSVLSPVVDSLRPRFPWNDSSHSDWEAFFCLTLNFLIVKQRSGSQSCTKKLHFTPENSNELILRCAETLDVTLTGL